MVSTTRILAWGYIVPAITIAVLCILLHLRTQELRECTGRIDQAAAEARGALEASQVAQEHIQRLRAERDAQDAAYDSLLTKYQQRRSNAIPHRPRTAPERRESILRATRER